MYAQSLLNPRRPSAILLLFSMIFMTVVSFVFQTPLQYSQKFLWLVKWRTNLKIRWLIFLEGVPNCKVFENLRAGCRLASEYSCCSTLYNINMLGISTFQLKVINWNFYFLIGVLISLRKETREESLRMLIWPPWERSCSWDYEDKKMNVKATRKTVAVRGYYFFLQA